MYLGTWQFRTLGKARETFVTSSKTLRFQRFIFISSFKKYSTTVFLPHSFTYFLSICVFHYPTFLCLPFSFLFLRSLSLYHPFILSQCLSFHFLLQSFSLTHSLSLHRYCCPRNRYKHEYRDQHKQKYTRTRAHTVNTRVNFGYMILEIKELFHVPHAIWSERLTKCPMGLHFFQYKQCSTVLMSPN